MTTWATDMEAEDWQHFVMGGAESDEGEVVIFDDNDVSAWADWYRELPKGDEVIAHFGGSYDFLQLIAATPDLTWSGTLAGSSIVTCRARGHALCRDTFRLFPLSLAAWTRSKSETGLPCRGEKRECIEAMLRNGPRGCGGYCSIRRDMPPELRRRLREYMVNDIHVLLHQWTADTERLAADGLEVITDQGRIRSTVGGVGWHTAATMAGLDPHQSIEWSDYDAGRRAYFGGRTEVGRMWSPGVGYRYDVHAMYPWALTQDVPFGNRRSILGHDARREYDRNPLGIYHAVVDVPESDLPPLPHRYDGPNRGRFVKDRLLWTTGHLNGTWSGIELRHAEECGARIISLDIADVWSDAGPLFADYVTHIYKKRREAIASCPHGAPPKCDCDGCRWGAVLKWFANAPTGKFAQRPGVSSLCVIGSDDDPGEGWTQHGPPGSRVYSSTTVKVPSSGMTWVAATLTARSRVKLHERLWRHSGAWLYCDTDSTYLLRRDEHGVHPSELGTFGYEGEAHDWHALAPKLYRYRDERGKEHVRARGVSRASWSTYDALLRGDTVVADGGVQRIKTSGGAFVARTVKRSHLDHGTTWCGTRHVLPSGATRPLHRARDGSYE